MGTFGERLQREREMRGITLEEIAEATKIGTRSLRALEQEQFEKLPGGIFNKGFVRAYSRYLGIDEEQAVADYLAAVQETEEPAEPQPQMAEGDVPEAPAAAAVPWRAFAAIVLLAILVAAGWYLYNRRKAQQDAAAPIAIQDVPTPAPAASSQPAPQPPPVVPDTSSATLSPSPTAQNASPADSASKPAAAPELKKTGQSATDTSISANPAPITLRIRAHSDAWMHITADGKVVMSEILTASNEKVIRAEKQVVLDIGNAGGVEITQNGKPLAPLGPEGKRKVVTFTPEGIQQ